MYLLAWSPVLWPAALPEFPTTPTIPPDVDPDVSKESWDEELLNVGLFRAALPAVRRVLANVPTLMIFDDHEVTDDWNIDHAWVNSVYGEAGGRRAVTNGLLAYALCQHWGNKPARVHHRRDRRSGGCSTPSSTAVSADPADEPGHRVRTLARRPDRRRCRRRRPRRCCATSTAAGAIRYDLTLGPDEGWPVRIVLLDERTAREYPRADSRGARISRAALAVQLPPPPSPVPFTIVVAAAPILGSELVEDVIQPLFDVLKPGGARFADFESWSAVRANHQDLLARLAAHHPVVVLSGDVHYGFTTRLTRTEGRRHDARRPADGVGGEERRDQERRHQPVQRAGDAPRAGARARDIGLRVAVERRQDEAAEGAAGRQRGWRGTTPSTSCSVASRARAPSAPTAIADAGRRGLRAGAPRMDLRGRARRRPDEPTSPPPPVDAPWPGWDPGQVAAQVAAALQEADLERFARVFVGLPQLAVVSFTVAGASVTVHHELRCPVGKRGAGAPTDRTSSRPRWR